MATKSGTAQRLSTVALILLGMIALPRVSEGANWPLWRGDAGNSGSSSETIVLPLTLRWHSTAPDVEENGVVVANGVAYMSTENGFLHAFSVATGFEVAGFPVVTAASYGTPAVDLANGKVYVLAAATLHARNLDGTAAWTAAVGATGSNYSEGPVVEDGFVYVVAGGAIKKFDAAGVLQWTSSPAGTLAGGTQASIMGGHLYANNESGAIRKYDKATGVEVTTGGFPITTAGSVSAPTTVNGAIYYKADVLYAYSATDGTLLWSAAAGGYSNYSGSPAVSNGTVYVYGWDGLLYAFDAATGVPETGFPSAALNTAFDRNYGSPAVAGDKVFVGAGTTQKLKVVGAAGTANAGVVLEEDLTFSADPQGFDLCSPAISDGWVFGMLDGGGLYAFQGLLGPSSGVVEINDGASCTESQDVTLALDNGGNSSITEMIISEDPFFTGASYEPFAATKNWALSAGFGTKTVYVKLKDSTGLESNVFSDSIDYLDNCQTIDLTPAQATNPINTPHTVTATVEDSSQVAQPGVEVTFEVVSGPNIGAAGVCSANADCVTDANGEVSFTYTGSGGIGTDLIRGCFVNQSEGQTCSQPVSKEWISGGCPQDCGDPAVAHPTITAVDAGYILRTAVELEECLLCICDLDNSGSVLADDALADLRYAVGLPEELNCPDF
ncbi:MAG: PQQ-binding-like beta-propeller repeat protein [Deltaproteobacteria bacterium]|nr:PQQ-binding-like beta-propeller repeat protein [Deltaproteobacteria bacterium]